MSDVKGAVLEFVKQLQSLDAKFGKGSPNLVNATLDPNYDRTNWPTGGQPNDVHPDFFRYITSLAYTMREIEQPNVEMQDVAEKFGDKIFDIVEAMKSGSTSNYGRLDTKPLRFENGMLEQLSPNQSGLTWAVTGFGLLNRNNYLGITNSARTAYNRAIFYLLHFIALLDFTINKPDAFKVIAFLKNNDAVTFAPLVTEITDDISSTKFGNKSIDFNNRAKMAIGVEKGLVAIADIIINKFSEPYFTNNQGNYLNKLNTVVDDIATHMKGKAINSPTIIKLKLNTLGLEDALIGIKKSLDVSAGDIKLAGELFGKDDNYIKVSRIVGLLNAFHTDVGIASGTPDKLAFKEYNFGGQQAVGNNAQDLLNWQNEAIAWYKKSLGLSAGTVINYNDMIGVGANKYADEPALILAGQRAVVALGDPIFPARAKPVAGVQGPVGYPNASFLYTPEAKIDQGTAKIGHQYLFTKDVEKLTILPADLKKLVIDTVNVLDSVQGYRDLDILAGKAGILGLVFSALADDLDLSGAIGADSVKIKNGIIKNLRGFDQIAPRLKFIMDAVEEPERIFSQVPILNDEFVRGFILGTKRVQFGEKNTIDADKLSARQKIRAPLSVWKDVYTEITSTPEKIQYFREIFNLVKIDSNGKEIRGDVIELDTATKPNQDLGSYSLNVKKNKPEVAGMYQYGGVAGIDDINFFFFLVPEVDPSKINNILIDMNGAFIPHSAISASNFILNEIVRRVYFGRPSDLSAIRFGGSAKAVDINRTFTSFASSGFKVTSKGIAGDYHAYYVPYGGPETITNWEQYNSDLVKALTDLPDKSRWEREFQDWNYLDKDRKPIARDQRMDCAFLNKDKCDNFIRCISNSSDNKECFKFLTRGEYILDIPGKDQMAQVIDQVKLMNPLAAARFLSNIGFRIERQEVDLARNTGGRTRDQRKMRQDRAECVSNWVANLPNLQSVFGTDHQAVLTQIVTNPNKTENKNLFCYLSILVDWVNANPQVLNQEDTLDIHGTARKTDYPEADKSFKIYDYVGSPAKPVKRMRSLCDGLIRMKSDLENDLSGFNSATLLSNIYNTPNYNMPLNRAVFIRGSPQMALNMYGGVGPFEASLGNYSKSYGADVFNNWFGEIKNTLHGIRGNNDFGMKIQKKTEDAIDMKLTKFRQIEDEIIHLMTEVIKRKELFRTSNGRLDIGQISRDDYEQERGDRKAVLEKHSNLVQYIDAHQKRALNLTDIMTNLADTIVNKLEEMEKRGHSQSQSGTFNQCGQPGLNGQTVPCNQTQQPQPYNNSMSMANKIRGNKL